MEAIGGNELTVEAQVVDVKEAFLEAAFPPGSTTLLFTPTGPEKEALLAPLVHGALTEGSKVLLAFSNVPPRRFLRKLSLLGSDVSGGLADGKLRLLDWYSHKEEDVQERVDEDGVVQCPPGLKSMEEALRALIASEDGKGVAILEILTDSISGGRGRGLKFTSMLGKKLKKGYATSILVADVDLIPGSVVKGLKDHVDGFVEVNRERYQDEVTWTASIPREGKETSYFSLKMEPPFLDFTIRHIDEKGFKVMAKARLEAEEVAEACPECGAPLEGQECDVCGYAPEDPRLKKIEEVYERCEATLREDPRNTDALFTKAAAQARMKDFEPAVHTLNELTKLDPVYPGMWMLKAKLFDRLGDGVKANLCRQRAIEIQEEETGPSVEATVQSDSEKFQCPLCQRWLPLDATICPCGAEFVEE